MANVKSPQAIEPHAFLYDVYDGLLDRIFKLVCDDVQSENHLDASIVDPTYLFDIATCIHTTAITSGVVEPENCLKRRMIVEVVLFLKCKMKDIDSKFDAMMNNFRSALPSSWDVGEQSRFFDLLVEFRLHAILKTIKSPGGPVSVLCLRLLFLFASLYVLQLFFLYPYMYYS